MGISFRSTVRCPECNSPFWLKAYSSKLGHHYECSNCCHTRPQRKTPGKPKQMTPRQKRSVERIKAVIADRAHIKVEDLAKVDVEFNADIGQVWVNVHAHQNVYLDMGFSAYIGVRGGIKVYSAHGLSKVYTPEVWAKILGCSWSK